MIKITRKLGVLVFLIACVSVATEASEYSEAKFQGKIDLGKVGCASGEFWDPRNGGECWSCNGKQRDILHPVTSDKACFTPAHQQLTSAVKHADNITVCASGEIQAGGACWTCPSGYKHDIAKSITSSKVCYKKHGAKDAKMGKTSSKHCKIGGDGIKHKGDCYRCSSGYDHVLTKSFNKTGICHKPSYKSYHHATKHSTLSGLKCPSGQAYDPAYGGSCWTCPSGYTQTANAITGSKACAKDFPKVHSAASLKKSSNLASQGCAKGQIVDPRNGGECWSCPSSNPVRTEFPVTSTKACVSKTCGGLNERPCLVWERIPSCNKGLLEDPVKHECVKPADFACDATMTTLVGFHNLMNKAESMAEDEFQKALDNIPGARALLASAKSGGKSMKTWLEKQESKIDIKPLDNQFQQILKEPEVFDKLGKVAKVVSKSKSGIQKIILDKELMCGDTQKIIAALNKLGFNEKLIAQNTHSGVLDFIIPSAHADATDIVPSFDFGMDIFPVPMYTMKLGKAQAKLEGMIGLSMSTNFIDSLTWTLDFSVGIDVGEKEEEDDETEEITLRNVLGSTLDDFSFGVGDPTSASDDINRWQGAAGFSVLGIYGFEWDLDEKPAKFDGMSVDFSYLKDLFSLVESVKEGKPPKVDLMSLATAGGGIGESLVINSTHVINENSKIH